METLALPSGDPGREIQVRGGAQAVTKTQPALNRACAQPWPGLLVAVEGLNL